MNRIMANAVKWVELRARMKKRTFFCVVVFFIGTTADSSQIYQALSFLNSFCGTAWAEEGRARFQTERKPYIWDSSKSFGTVFCVWYVQI